MQIGARQRASEAVFDNSRMVEFSEQIQYDAPAVQLTPLVQEGGRLVVTNHHYPAVTAVLASCSARTSYELIKACYFICPGTMNRSMKTYKIKRLDKHKSQSEGWVKHVWISDVKHANELTMLHKNVHKLVCATSTLSSGSAGS